MKLSNMNLPNKLTLLRVCLIPFFILFMLLSLEGKNIEAARAAMSLRFCIMRIIALIIFSAASITDYFDGHIARRDGLVTNFGKFMDPLADKLLVCSALILFAGEGSLSSLAVIIIIAREFTISGFRLVASDNGVVIAASWWGKVKTVSQMILCIILILPHMPVILGDGVMFVLTAIVVTLTVISLIDYIAKNIRVISSGNL